MENVWRPRRSNRLGGFDYATSGAYFVTICCRNRVCLLGEVRERRVFLGEIGEIVEAWWLRLPDKFPTVRLDTWIVMPNHLHAVLELRPPLASGIQQDRPTLARVVQWYKTMTTNSVLRSTQAGTCGKLWQRGYHERIIRCEAELDRIRDYIRTNPIRW